MGAIDLNADLGETVDGMPTADDAAMFAVISSASIACGGHAGDERSMREAVARAAAHDVAVGAHPSYPDPANFGRAPMAIAAADLRVEVAGQLRTLAAAGADIRYVKPHGALYHAVSVDAEQARAMAEAVAELAGLLGRAVPILGMPGEITRAAGAAGLPFVVEAFLDRGYLPSGGLVPRGRPGAVLDDAAAAAERAIRLARSGEVVAVDGSVLEVAAASLCLHGDSPAAVAMGRAVREALDAAGLIVRSPW
ncbi:5-oxoprolinase subunit PxpA [Microbacterium sp. ET2]|uniref:5-oxoprolinase subunit PxpA n=1 Tax=Microbacterium albipurpureum TaxID=3050384 RepID=UPI00259C6E5A|nr:5-oxoprolinase subunit PxpA [Microbacterium sp. ET2 (Ac-2212)]WJL94560.1 5-oxoprolinase subunit PxpA [Microbacterium sp. ET2 (Ac-2212)]